MGEYRDKKKLVEELIKHLNDLSVDQLYILPRQNSTKNYLADIAAIFKNLDESDYQEFVSLSKKIQPDIEREERKKAAHDIDIFMRRKIAEWERYDFDSSGKNQESKSFRTKINIFKREHPFWFWLTILLSISSFMWSIFVYKHPNLQTDQSKNGIITNSLNASNLISKFSDLTDIQRKVKSSKYIGKTLTSEGYVLEVTDTNITKQNLLLLISFSTTTSWTSITCRFDQNWRDKLLVLDDEEFVRFKGIILEINHSSIDLEKCELQ